MCVCVCVCVSVPLTQLDIFAVHQHPTAEQAGDLDFASVVIACDYFLLSSAHLDEVVNMSIHDAIAHRVPETAKKLCAFFRVWCLVEVCVRAATASPPLSLSRARRLLRSRANLTHAHRHRHRNVCVCVCYVCVCGTRSLRRR